MRCFVWLTQVGSTKVRAKTCGMNQQWTTTTCNDLYCNDDAGVNERERECNLDHPWQGCWCKTGYRRNQNYDCVAEARCNDSCPENERPIRDSQYCEYYCNTSDKCHLKKKEFCTCMPGYFRNIESGVCVRKAECPQPTQDPIAPISDDY